MAESSISFKGIDKVVANLTLSAGRVRGAVKFALEEAGGDLLKESVKIVPHDIGTLENSGKVSPVEKISSDQMSVSVGFNTPYAARMHEHPEYKFQKGRRGKYLETPLKENVNKYKNGIVSQVKSSLEGAL